MASTQTLLSGINYALNSKNGEEAVRLLQEHLNLSSINRRNFIYTLNPNMIPKLCSQHLNNPQQREFMTDLLGAMVDVTRNNMEQAYKQVTKAFKLFLDNIFKNDTTAWTFPIVKLLMKVIREFSIPAEKQARKNQQPSSKANMDAADSAGGEEDESSLLEDAARSIMRCFQLSGADRSSLDGSDGTVTKKWLLLDIANNLFKIYFNINKLRLCKNLIKTIDEGRNLPPFEHYPMAAKVTYQFYAGKIAMFDSDFTVARQKLLYAYNNCLPTSVYNLKLILQYLIPIQWICGKSPSYSLLRRYQMKEFIELNRAYRTGNLKAFQAALEKNQDFFIRKGILLIIEKSKTIVYRNLFRTIVQIRDNSTRIKISDFMACLQYLGEEDVDLDEVECILCTLIFQNYIKGYLSHSKRMLVLSKQNAFPPITNQHETK